MGPVRASGRSLGPPGARAPLWSGASATRRATVLGMVTRQSCMYLSFLVSYHCVRMALLWGTHRNRRASLLHLTPTQWLQTPGGCGRGEEGGRGRQEGGGEAAQGRARGRGGSRRRGGGRRRRSRGGRRCGGGRTWRGAGGARRGAGGRLGGAGGQGGRAGAGMRGAGGQGGRAGRCGGGSGALLFLMHARFLMQNVAWWGAGSDNNNAM